MIEGLIRHNTEIRVEKNFVDSHELTALCIAGNAGQVVLVGSNLTPPFQSITA